MLRYELEQSMQRLCTNYDRKLLSEGKIKLWFEKLENFTTSQLTKAVESIIEGHEKFPTLSVLLANLYAHSGIDTKQRELDDLEKAKEEHFEHPPDPEYVKESIELVRSAGHLTKEAYYQAMLRMEEKWPGKGWGEEAESCLMARNAMLKAKKGEVESVGEAIVAADQLPF